MGRATQAVMDQIELFGAPPSNKGRRIMLIDLPGEVHRRWHGLEAGKWDPRSVIGAEVVKGVRRFSRKLDVSIGDTFCIDDGDEPTWRHREFPAYKAQRNSNDALHLQRPSVRAALAEAGFTVVQVPDREADDVIATMCRVAVGAGNIVTVVSMDKDLLQLVDDGRVSVYNPMKDQFFAEDDVVKKLGVIPCRVGDYLAMVGDSSDNLPGIAGIGPKGALKILETFGTLGSALDALSGENPNGRGLPKSMCAKIAGAQEIGRTMYRLVQLESSVPLPLGLTESLK